MLLAPTNCSLELISAEITAYEATTPCLHTSGFAQKLNCMFIVSTHIMEAGEILKDQYPNINFLFLPTKLQDSVPVSTRKLEPRYQCRSTWNGSSSRMKEY